MREKEANESSKGRLTCKLGSAGEGFHYSVHTVSLFEMHGAIRVRPQRDRVNPQVAARVPAE